jgi:hypothetical protein
MKKISGEARGFKEGGPQVSAAQLLILRDALQDASYGPPGSARAATNLSRDLKTRGKALDNSYSDDRLKWGQRPNRFDIAGMDDGSQTARSRLAAAHAYVRSVYSPDTLDAMGASKSTPKTMDGMINDLARVASKNPNYLTGDLLAAINELGLGLEGTTRGFSDVQWVNSAPNKRPPKPAKSLTKKQLIELVNRMQPGQI